MKIVNESILFFSRVSLSKFSLEVLYISWVYGSLYSRVIRNMKSQFFLNIVVWQLGLTTRLSREFKL